MFHIIELVLHTSILNNIDFQSPIIREKISHQIRLDIEGGRQQNVSK